MEKILKMLARLFPGKSFTEDAVAEELKAAVDAEKSKAVEDATAPLSARIKELAPLEAKMKEIEPLAADGKAYRESMVADYVTMKAKLGDVSEKPEDQAELKTVAAAYPMKFLKTEVETLRKRVEEKFPAGSQIAGDDPNDKRGPGGKKNALIPEEK